MAARRLAGSACGVQRDASFGLFPLFFVKETHLRRGPRAAPRAVARCTHQMALFSSLLSLVLWCLFCSRCSSGTELNVAGEWNLESVLYTRRRQNQAFFS